MRALRCLHFLLLCIFGQFLTVARAVDSVAISPRERAQGFRDGVLLAKPRAAHRATVDGDETKERIRIRARFSHLHDLRVVELDAGDDLSAAKARLEASGRYEFVEHDQIRVVNATPNDPSFSAQWPLSNSGQSGGFVGADIKAQAAWDIIHDAPNVVVAVLDTGVNLTHQDLAPNLWVNRSPSAAGDRNGANFVGGRGAMVSGNPSDDGGHGSHVAGIIGAVGNNGVGVSGVAWKVQIMAVRVFPGTGSGSVSDVVAGINYAISHGAQIINASYGDTGGSSFSQTELDAVRSAREAGIIFVAAAGNDAANMDISRHYPASFSLDNIVTVGSTTRGETLSGSSNYGTAVDILAPGESILSLGYTSNTATAILTGTSMAAPHVTGALALLKAQFPADNYRQLINRLLRGAEVIPRYSGRSQNGSRLNLLGALTTTTNRPFNDDFAARAKLTGSNFLVRTSNTGATLETGLTEPTSGNASLWWEWTPSASAAVRLTTAGSAYDTVLEVFTGTPGGGSTSPTLTSLAANDNDGASRTSRIDFRAQAGTTYYIAVGGKNAEAGLTLLNLGTEPTNDSFAAPTTLEGVSAGITATNANCTREAGEPRIFGFSGGTSLWYNWKAPRTGRYQFAVFSNDFDPLLAVYTGSSFETLKLVSAETISDPVTPPPTLCTFDAIAGTTYLVGVDSTNPSSVGQFTLTVCDALWQAQTSRVNSPLPGSPAVAPDGTLYIGSVDRSLYAFAPDGALKWTYATAALIDTCSPAVDDDGTVYFGANDGFFRALNPDGTLKWSHSFNSNSPAITYTVSNSPAIAADGTIYVKANDGFLYALDPTNGFTKWSVNVNAIVSYASPVVARDGTIYQGSEDKKLYAINPDGTIKWTYTSESEIYTAPAIDAAGNIYFGALSSGWLYSLTPAGTLRWIYKDATVSTSSSPALSADGATVYYGAYDRKLHAVSTADGTGRWTYLLGDEVRASSPAVDSRGVIYIGCYDYKLYALNPDGTLNRTWSTGNWIRSAPAIFGSTLYVGSNDHKLYALDLGATTGPGVGPWPQYRHNSRRLGRAIIEPLAVTRAPLSQVAGLGLPLNLSIVATGEAPLTFQWRKDGAAIAGATSPAYSVVSATLATAGAYTVTVSGPQGSVTSVAATIKVEPPNPGRLANLSVRTMAGSDAQSLIVGFAVAGATKPVLLRGIGPGLTAFGVTGALPDPKLELVAAGANTPLATNDNWPASATAIFSRVGAFPLFANSRDAALVTTLPPGAYTAQLSDTTGETGQALFELYDTDAATGTARISNVSTRAQVSSGEGILIAGFALSGNLPRTVLIRAIGPALTAFGVSGALADPRLELYRGTTPLENNDNWGATTGGTAPLSAAFTAVGAFPLPFTTSRDAVLLTTLTPGTYTVQISGVNGSAGVALLEIYEVR